MAHTQNTPPAMLSTSTGQLQALLIREEQPTVVACSFKGEVLRRDLARFGVVVGDGAGGSQEDL